MKITGAVLAFYCAISPGSCPVWAPATASQEILSLARKLSEWGDERVFLVPDERYDARALRCQVGQRCFRPVKDLRQSEQTPGGGILHPIVHVGVKKLADKVSLARLVWLSGENMLKMAGISKGRWQSLRHSIQLTHFFSWLTLSTEQPGRIAGVTSERASQLYHQFNLSRKQPFKRWVKVLGVPVPLQAFKAMQEMRWESPLSRQLTDWPGPPDR